MNRLYQILKVLLQKIRRNNSITTTYVKNNRVVKIKKINKSNNIEHAKQQIKKSLEKLKQSEKLILDNNGHFTHLDRESSLSDIDFFMTFSEQEKQLIKKQKLPLTKRINNYFNSFFKKEQNGLMLTDKNGRTKELLVASTTLNSLKEKTFKYLKKLNKGEHLTITRNGHILHLNHKSKPKLIFMFLRNSYQVNSSSFTKSGNFLKLSDPNQIKVTKKVLNHEHNSIFSDISILNEKQLKNQLLELRNTDLLQVEYKGNIKYFSNKSKFSELQLFLERKPNRDKNPIFNSELDNDINAVINTKKPIEVLDIYDREEILTVLINKNKQNTMFQNLIKDEPDLIKNNTLIKEQAEIKKILNYYTLKFDRNTIPNKDLQKLGLDMHKLSKKNLDLLLSGQKTRKLELKPNKDLELVGQLKLVFNDRGGVELRIFPDSLELKKSNTQTFSNLVTDNSAVKASVSTAYISNKFFKDKDFGFDLLANKKQITEAFNNAKKLTNNLSLKAKEIMPDTWLKVSKEIATKYYHKNTPIIKERKAYYVGLITANMDEDTMAEHIKLLAGQNRGIQQTIQYSKSDISR